MNNCVNCNKMNANNRNLDHVRKLAQKFADATTQPQAIYKTKWRGYEVFGFCESRDIKGGGIEQINPRPVRVERKSVLQDNEGEKPKSTEEKPKRKSRPKKPTSSVE